MKVAIVGIGHIAQHQKNAIRKLTGNVELVGAYDRDLGVSRKRPLPCRFHKSLDDLIANSPADVVVVSTPNSDHFATVSTLLGAGRAVMVEKPVCENSADLAKLAKLAVSRNGFLHAAFHAAFARDLHWWTLNRAELADRFGPVKAFNMSFYDPYMGRDGTVQKKALGLGGSWIDSGINALSVLERIADRKSIKVMSTHMVSSPQISCDQIKGLVRLECLVDGEVCRGEIDTNWTLGLNRKTTMLSHADATVILDHSAQKVIIRSGNGRPQTISLQNGVSRLTNQYVGVFQDLKTAHASRASNVGLSTLLHELLFAAVALANGAPC
jgi:D-galactose 1-dehydrogenase